MCSDLVEQVKLQYKRSLPDKAEKLQTLWSQAENNPDQLLSFLHQLAGSAGMYGYDDVTAQSASLRQNFDAGLIRQLQSEFEKLHQLLIKHSK